MAELVVDSCVWVAAFLERDANHSQAVQFLDERQGGRHHCHLPYLVLVETCAVVVRQVPRNSMGYVGQVRRSFRRWTARGLISWYPLNQRRSEVTVDFNLGLLNPLRGGDSVVASLANELGCSLKTFDAEILQRYSKATV